MDAMRPTAPLTPRKLKEAETINLKIRMLISRLNFDWDLRLETPKDGESPINRRGQIPTIDQEIVFKIKALCFRITIDPLLQKFDTAANALHYKWAHKPKAERGAVPERTRHASKPITSNERAELLQCLLRTLNEQFDLTITPKKTATGNVNLTPRTHESRSPLIDDSPVPLKFPSKSKGESKRPREQFKNDDAMFKKPRLPDQNTTHTYLFRAPSENSRPQLSRSMVSEDEMSTRSAKTSFTSEASSFFSNPFLNTSNASLSFLTQESMQTQITVPDDGDSNFDRETYREPLNTSFEEARSSEYEGGSSFDAAVLEGSFDTSLADTRKIDPVIDEDLSQDLMEHSIIDGSELTVGETELRDGLQSVFPELPPSLLTIPLCVSYEITRIFLHAGVTPKESDFSLSPPWTDYDDVWKFLKGLPILRGKPFPERCSREVWDAALVDFHKGRRAVYMSGTLRYNPTDSDETAPLFRFQLSPLNFDLSHRCGRRFGHDRFFEIDMPNLTGRQVPKSLQQLGKRGPEIVLDWLVNGAHHFLGREWKPLHVKPKERRDRKVDSGKHPADDPDPVHRVYFFAVNGWNFHQSLGAIPRSMKKPHLCMSIDTLLNCIRPTAENRETSFLKLFARTSLALSRNTATVVLEKFQIRYKDDIYCGKEVMTDGGGRISPTLALKVSHKMGLSYLPSAFQGRIGEAKGLWCICYNDKSGQDWIEIYASQCKWKPSSGVHGESDHDSHRTFEVLKCSAPLKSADLNLQFLPLLIDRAENPKAMRKAISTLLKEGLAREIATLQTAMENPQSFRKWIRETNPNTKERLKAGAVPYRAGLPVTLEERLNVLLDAGFDPKQLLFMKDMTKTVFKNKCDDLKKRLNITVGKSTYAYMIPDFAGILEPDEVYIDLTSFVDNISGFSGVLLNEVDVLVARSPAHYTSDIQKVRVVAKAELMGLKDVIVFSTKGNPSLAAKLSGGDYDGDIAWVCWEPSLVDNFVNADIPECPDLVKSGFLRKNTMTYEQLAEGHSSSTATSIFLKNSFSFNMQQSLLGICTNYKEKICYTQGRVNTSESVFLSTLLSCLVDQAKNGYIFTEDDWTRIKQDIIRIVPKQPLYKTDHINANADHIIDHLMFVADKTIQASLTEFHSGLKDPPVWDDDLAAYHKWARQKGTQEPQWERLLDDLDKDIGALKTEWSNSFARKHDPNDESKPNFIPIVLACHEKFHAITPHDDNPLTQALLQDYLPDPEVSSWALLKASALFDSWARRNVRNMVWWVAGKQLAQLKAMHSRGMVSVVPHMYAMLKPDASFVKASMSEGGEYLMGDNRGVGNVEELESVYDEDD